MHLGGELGQRNAVERPYSSIPGKYIRPRSESLSRLGEHGVGRRRSPATEGSVSRAQPTP